VHLTVRHSAKSAKRLLPVREESSECHGDNAADQSFKKTEMPAIDQSIIPETAKLAASERSDYNKGGADRHRRRHAHRKREAGHD